MFLLEFLNFAVADGACSIDQCPGSAFNAITAALATQGYFKQADLLEYFSSDGALGSLATMVYVLAAFAGIASMAMGAPPKNYIWFFIGPGVYYFLIDSHLPAHGIRLMDMGGDKVQNSENAKEVWRMAQAGLHNNAYVTRYKVGVTEDSPPDKPAMVSNLFLWLDYTFSSLIEQLIPLTGVYDLNPGTGNIDSDARKNKQGERRNWSILTDLKWSMIENITAVQLSNPDVRDAFVTFLASKCGDVFARQIDDSLWISATQSRGDKIPWTVFKDDGLNPGQPGNTGGAGTLKTQLGRMAIPIPESVVNMLASGENNQTKASFLDSGGDGDKTQLKEYLNYINSEGFSGGISCDHYLWIVIHAFKYEAINIYNHIVNDVPGEFKSDPEATVFNLLYGWGINNLKAEGTNLEKGHKRRQEYLINLIFVYLIRNELAIAPKPRTTVSTSTNAIEKYVDTQISTIGSKTKYAEVYSWAKMMPYFQGVMLYVLAMAYPFCAMMVLVPGWHKIIVTWLTFWLWTKSWDLGFAVVKTLERSIWSMLGNDPNAQSINERVLSISQFMKHKSECSIIDAGESELGDCIAAKVIFEGNGLDTIENTFKALGRALGLSGNLVLDNTNGYYIYIMAALYFAVPGVTGQLILGAKAGAANLVGGMIQGLGDKASGAAGAGAQSQLAGAVQANASNVGQQAYIKASQGLSVDALASGNSAAAYGADSSANQTRSQLAQGAVGAAERRNQSWSSAMSPMESARSLGEAAQIMGAQNTANATQAWKDLSNAAGGTAPPTPPATPQTWGQWAGSFFGGGGSGSPGASAPVSGGGAPGGSTVGPGAAGMQAYKGPIPSTVAIGRNQMQQPAFDAANEVAANNNDRSIAAFQASNDQQRFQQNGQRMGGYANFAGESAAHRASAALHQQMGSYATIAAGTMGGSLIRPKPTANQDSAMSGILNSYSSDGNGSISTTRDGRGAANYFMPGQGFQQHVGSHVAGMQDMNGDKLRSLYSGGTMSGGFQTASDATAAVTIGNAGGRIDTGDKF